MTTLGNGQFPYGSPNIKHSCTHSTYWTTVYDNCMACRAERAEQQLAAMTTERDAKNREILGLKHEIWELIGTRNTLQARCRELEEQIQSWQLGKRVTDAATQIREDQIAQLQATLAELRAQYHPICLNCGREKPCMTEAEANVHGASSPCTFDPTPKQLFDDNKRLRATLAAREDELFACRSNFKQCELERNAAVQEAGRLREALDKAADELHSEFCGTEHHTFCIQAQKALKGASPHPELSAEEKVRQANERGEMWNGLCWVSIEEFNRSCTKRKDEQ